MKIRGLIRLERCKGIKAPMLIGLMKPVILLSDSYYNAEDLAFIFRHELTHYKRRDLWYKLVLVTMKSIYWFNPAVHLMASQANKDIETVCDALTVFGMSIDRRKRYSEIILSAASGARGCRSQLTTYFLGDNNMLRQRFSNILGAAKKSGAAIFITIGACVILFGFLVSFNFAQNPPEASVKTATTPVVPPDAGAREAEADALIQRYEETFPESIIGFDFPAFRAAILANTSTAISAARNNDDDELSALHKLVYDDAKMIEREIDDISRLSIISRGDSVIITRDGSKPVIRYYEWVGNQYLLVHRFINTGT